MKYQTSLAYCCIFSLALASVLSRPTLSAPYREQNSGFSSRDFVISDSEYGQLLHRLQSEVNDSIASDPRNFVDDVTSIEEIARMIENNGITTTTSATTSTSTLNPSQSSGPITESARWPEATSTTETPPVSVTKRENSIFISQEGEQATETPVIASNAEITTVNPECPICLEPFNGEPFELTPCAHKFHQNCLRTWEITVS